jgi:hypothetical protein
MVQVDNLAQLAEELCQLGIEATHEIVFALGVYQEGLDLGDDFFPLWELSSPENQDALIRLDFAAIKARRGANWSVAPPRLS